MQCEESVAFECEDLMSLIDRITESKKKDDSKSKDGVEYAVVSESSSEAGDAPAQVELFGKLLLALSIVALVLSLFPSLAASGLMLGGFVLAFSWYAVSKKKVDIKKPVMALGACAVFLGMVVAGVSANEATNDKLQLAQTGQELVALQEKAAAQEEELAKEDPVLSLEVVGARSSGVKTMQITVTGTTDDGVAVNDTRTVMVGARNVLGCPAGTYQFAYAAFTAPDGKTIYKDGAATCSCKKDTAETVSLQLVENTEEMQRIAAEEEAARLAAEEAAQAEAAAAAEAEAAAAREAAQAQSSTETERTVYVTKTGEKYHASGCQYLKKSKIPMSKSSAISSGYTACSRCNP